MERGDKHVIQGESCGNDGYEINPGVVMVQAEDRNEAERKASVTDMRHKYPKTMHLDFSPGLTQDDRVIATLEYLKDREVVVTEKMDGENTSLYRDYFHARSLDSRHHPSRDWVKALHGRIAYLIAEGWRVCGENLYARHSIAYDNLESYFQGFSIWNQHNQALSWDETLALFKTMTIVPVREIYRGEFSRDVLLKLASELDVNRQEGFVVRVTDSFSFDDFSVKVAKWVRPQHVQSDKHWMHRAVVFNTLKP